MTTQIALRLTDEQLAALDAEVADGRAANRSDALRRAIATIERQQRYRRDEAILLELAKRGEPVYPDLEGINDFERPAID